MSTKKQVYHTPMSTPNNWFTDSIDDLIKNSSFKSITDTNIIYSIDKFLEKGMPIIIKLKSGFFVGQGDTDFCLMISYDDEQGKMESGETTVINGIEADCISFINGIKIDICCLDDIVRDDTSGDENGTLKSREQCSGEKALTLLKTFTFEYPDAVITTLERKPACLFAQNKQQQQQQHKDHKDQNKKKSNDLKKLGDFMGYMTFNVFKKLVQSTTHQNITVAIP